LRLIAALGEREKEMKLSEWQTFYDQMMTPLPQHQELTNFFANKLRQEWGTEGGGHRTLGASERREDAL
jgi:hypothetical protein